MISIHVLGAPVVRRSDGPVAGRAAHRRRLAIVAILAAARGRPVARERMIGLLWAESSTDAARHSLSEGLYVLRKDLGEESFVVVGDEVGLDLSRVRIDLDEFELAVDEGRWEDAVKTYGGPFLEGFYVSDAPEFERWVDGERDLLGRAYGRALGELALAAEAADDPLRAAEWWRRLLAHDAFSSRVALRLVRVLERAGERAAALRAAEAHVLLLREELGVGPDAELAALVEELRRQPPAPTPRSAPTVSTEQDREADPPQPAAPAPSLAALGTQSGGSGIAARTEEGAAPPDEHVAATPVRRRRGFGLAAAGVGAMAAVLGLVALASGRDSGPPPGPEYDLRRVAVLYLDDDSPNGDLQYLANGLTEMLIHQLSQVQALDVVPRNGVKVYRAGTIPFDSMVAQLRVGSVVEGSVTRSADSVRVVVQLIDANSRSHLESREIVRPLGDVLALQRAVSEEVSGFLRSRLGRQVRLRALEAETRSGRALELALRGEEAYADALELRRSDDPADIASAQRMLAHADALLARAEAADPRWTRPTVGRAWVALRAGTWSQALERSIALDSAAARAGRVLAREPANARALEARGTALWTRGFAPGAAGDSALVEAGEQDLRAALAADPRLASAWGTLSVLLFARGEMAASAQAAQRALEHDAWLEGADALLVRRIYALYFVGDNRAAADACAQGRRLFSRDFRFVECRLTHLRYTASRDTALAWRLVAELDAMDPPAAAVAAGRPYSPIFRRVVAAAVSARAGDADRARAELARARVAAATDVSTRVSLAYDEAVLLLLLGDREGARERLDVYLAQFPTSRGAVARDPVLRALLTPGAASTAP